MDMNLATEFMPIIVLTADTEEETKRKALSVGANDFLTKPLDVTEVSLRIKNLLYSVYLMEQLKDYNLILEKKVNERTTELREKNTELIIAKNKAEEINKLKSFFLSNISHEFRTPLISILGFSEVLMSELENEDHKSYSKFIYESGQRLQKTLNDIISLTYIEKKKIEASIKKVNLLEYIESISSEYRTKVEKKGLVFELHKDGEEISISTDPELLKYAIDNIVDNAIKFTSKGNISVNVSLNEENNTPYAVISIVDTGKGIAKEKLDNIFVAFRQGSEGLNRTHEGMGIGLSIAKQLVEILKGEIAIQSQEGVGTTLIVSLPIKQTESKVNERVNSVKQTFVQKPKNYKQSKPLLLMVEDNSSNRILFQKILRDDFFVDEAEDGITAIAKAEVKSYDVILMDINLGPGIDGVETFHKIRTMTNYVSVPVIAVTAFAMKDDRSKFIEQGFTDYLQKPVLREDLLSVIKNHVGKK